MRCVLLLHFVAAGLSLYSSLICECVQLSTVPVRRSSPRSRCLCLYVITSLLPAELRQRSCKIQAGLYAVAAPCVLHETTVWTCCTTAHSTIQYPTHYAGDDTALRLQSVVCVHAFLIALCSTMFLLCLVLII
jgi:hypothetical protein